MIEIAPQVDGQEEVIRDGMKRGAFGEENSPDEIDFGKLVGKTFRQVFMEDPEYCSWTVRQKEKETWRSQGQKEETWISEEGDWISDGHGGWVKIGVRINGGGIVESGGQGLEKREELAKNERRLENRMAAHVSWTSLELRLPRSLRQCGSCQSARGLCAQGTWSLTANNSP